MAPQEPPARPELTVVTGLQDAGRTGRAGARTRGRSGCPTPSWCCFRGPT